MGLSSADTATEAIQLCIFDLRRGQQEGQELDKILFFFPADFPFSRQLSVIGLSEGLITFTRLVLVCMLCPLTALYGTFALLLMKEAWVKDTAGFLIVYFYIHNTMAIYWATLGFFQ